MTLPAPAATGRVTLAYMTTAVAAFVAAALALPWLAPELAGHYYHPRVLALTHTVTLGWITLTIMGATYQIVPVHLECPLWSQRLAWWQLGFAVVGTLGMVSHFFIGEWRGLAWAAGVFALAVLAHVVNVGMSVRGLRRWTFTAATLVLALGGLGLATLAGVVLGIAHVWPFLPWPFFARLHAHVHLALLGWVLPMIVGVASDLYPMFLLAPSPRPRLLAVQLTALAAGVPLVVIGLLDHPRLLGLGAAAIAVAVGGHLVSIVGMVRRRRARLDWGLAFVLTGAAHLLIASLVGLAIVTDVGGGPRLALAYGSLVLGGWISLTIVGMMLKIVPFLVWYRAYADRIGREPVPTLAEISFPGGEGVSYALLSGGVLALGVALLVGDTTGIRLAGTVVAGGAVTLAATLGRIVRHLWAGPLIGRAHEAPPERTQPSVSRSSSA